MLNSSACPLCKAADVSEEIRAFFRIKVTICSFEMSVLFTILTSAKPRRFYCTDNSKIPKCFEYAVLVLLYKKKCCILNFLLYYKFLNKFFGITCIKSSHCVDCHCKTASNITQCCLK